GERFTIQPALDGRLEPPGYAYPYIGGAATYVIIPALFIECNSLLHYDGDAFFYGSLAEPMSCIVGGFHVNYHTKGGSYVHEMGIVKGGNLAILAGAGPMGLGAIDYAIHCDRKPGLIVVTDINDERLARAAEILSPEMAKKEGVELKYINTANMADPTAELMALTGGKGYNDVYVYAPVKPVVEMGDALLAHDGCLNFFAGPTDPKFNANFNFYNVHYAATHIAGNSGGNTDDMIESITMMQEGKIDPAAMVTHIGGLNAVAETTLNLPKIPGGKKLIYPNIDLELTAIDDFEKLGETNPMFAELAKITKANKGLWCAAAEKYLLANAKSI
ncbi:MAG: zinc-binding dehydrogenase, partial [Clostridia bacterium]|nr:zinc-binding dehydrogenase [Clostridia bacterium]